MVVGTPGRLLDHLERRTLDLSHIEVVVLDEADRMLDMGFIDDIKRILSYAPASKQTALFSATMPKEIMGLARKYLTSPEIVKESSDDELTVEGVAQYYLSIDGNQKLDALATILKERSTRTIVFTRTKYGADRLSHFIQRFGLNALALHGNLSQNRRDRVMDEFKNGRLNILIATDLAARGLHVEDVSHVINYDLPQDAMTYVHRIGRTGRQGKTGEAITFTTSLQETRELEKMVRQIGAEIQKLDMAVKHVAFSHESTQQRDYSETNRGGGRRERGSRHGSPRQSYGNRSRPSYGRGGSSSHSHGQGPAQHARRTTHAFRV